MIHFRYQIELFTLCFGQRIIHLMFCTNQPINTWHLEKTIKLLNYVRSIFTKMITWADTSHDSRFTLPAMTEGSHCQPWQQVHIASHDRRFTLPAMTEGSHCQPWQKVHIASHDRRFTLPTMTEGSHCQPWQQVHITNHDRRFTLPAMTEGSHYQPWQKVHIASHDRRFTLPTNGNAISPIPVYVTGPSVHIALHHTGIKAIQSIWRHT